MYALVRKIRKFHNCWIRVFNDPLSFLKLYGFSIKRANTRRRWGCNMWKKVSCNNIRILFPFHCLFYFLISSLPFLLPFFAIFFVIFSFVNLLIRFSSSVCFIKCCRVLELTDVEMLFTIYVPLICSVATGNSISDIRLYHNCFAVCAVRPLTTIGLAINYYYCNFCFFFFFILLLIFIVFDKRKKKNCIFFVGLSQRLKIVWNRFVMAVSVLAFLKLDRSHFILSEIFSRSLTPGLFQDFQAVSIFLRSSWMTKKVDNL